MVNANQKAKATQPTLPTEDKKKGDKPSLAIGGVEAAYDLAMSRLIKLVVMMTAFIKVIIDHATPQRRAAVARRLAEMRDVIVAQSQAMSDAVDTLLDHVKAEVNANLAGERPKFVRKTADALKDLGLDIDLASEFIHRKQKGTPFADDGDVHDEILLELGFVPNGYDQPDTSDTLDTVLTESKITV